MGHHNLNDVSHAGRGGAHRAQWCRGLQMTDGTTRRVLANAGWMLGGQGMGAILSLLYLALATRTLGAAGFGTFSMVLAVSSAIGTLVAFQSWQIVVHYGMDHLNAGREEELGRLLWFCAALDFFGMAVGSVASLVAIALLSGPFGWDATTTWSAAAFCVLTMMGIRSTPVGVLRLHDRFAIASGAETVAPVVKTLGAVACWWLGTGIGPFLMVWGVADVIVAVAYWWLAATRCGAPWRPGARPSIDGVRRDNEGIWRYALATNATSSLKVGSRSVAILMVGWLAGPAAAGAYRICLQLSQSATKVSQTISRAVFPELARARLAGDGDLGQVVWRTTRMVGTIAGVAAVTLPLIGHPLLAVVGGGAYVSAYGALMVMGAAAVLEMTGSALEPALFASGRGGVALRAGILSTITTVCLMVPATIAGGAWGAAWAVLAGTIVSFAMCAATVMTMVRGRTGATAVA